MPLLSLVKPPAKTLHCWESCRKPRNRENKSEISGPQGPLWLPMPGLRHKWLLTSDPSSQLLTESQGLVKCDPFMF